MANTIQIPDSAEGLQHIVSRVFQSANINFLIGSGASFPAIPVAGEIEQEIAGHFSAGEVDEANAKLVQFLTSVQDPMNRLIDGVADADNESTLENYVSYLMAIERILLARRNSILPPQANVFTTNYDLFVEKASEACSTLRLIDGFARIPSIHNRSIFSSSSFFDSISNASNVYGYKVELPRVNLIKIHGSLSWKKNGDDLQFEVATRQEPEEGEGGVAVQEFIDGFSLILPRQAKFEETMMDRIYYDLLRIYSNELEKENAVLVVFGFSFADAHIYDITKRALRNPTLKIIVFAYSAAEADALAEKFASNNNVEVVRPADNSNIVISDFVGILDGIAPSWGDE